MVGKEIVMKKRMKKFSWFDFINGLLVLSITILITYPLYYCIIASFSSPSEVAMGRVLFWIKDFTVDAYKFIMANKELWRGYLNSIIYTIFGTMYNLLLTIPLAYALSKRDLPGRQILNYFFFITMYFAGGLIPTYLTMRDYGLVNNPWIMVLGAGVSCYNMIVARRYFMSSIPNELYEAADIDGASEWKKFTSIAMPLAKPITAVLALYYGTEHWNGFYKAMIYLNRRPEWHSLQLVIRKIVSVTLTEATAGSSVEEAGQLLYMTQLAGTMKFAVVFIASAPMLIAFPFVQKHFTSGMFAGSVKG